MKIFCCLCAVSNTYISNVPIKLKNVVYQGVSGEGVKRIAVILMYLFSAAVITTGCGGDDGESDVKQLWIALSDTSYEKRFFNRAGSGSRSVVWVEEGMSVSGDTVNALISYFDGTVYPTVTTNFAASYDSDGDGKTALVIFAGDTGSTYIAGYMSPYDFYSNMNYSNRWDAVYLNGAHPSHLPGSDAFNNTLGHEFQHHCNFSRNVIEEHGGDYNYMMYTWIDEGLSENAGAMCAGLSSNYSRILHYMSDPDTVNGQRSVTIWDKSIDNYDMVYLYMGYLRERLGNSAMKAIIDHSNNGTSAVDAVITVKGFGGFNDFFESFVKDLRTASNFPTGFFHPGYSAPVATGSSQLRSYAFVYSGDFTVINSSLTYYDSSGKVTTNAANAVTAVYLDGDKNTWVTQNSSDTQQNFTVSSILTSSVLSAALRTVSGEEEGRVDMVIRPEGAPGIVVGSEDDTDEEEYYE